MKNLGVNDGHTIEGPGSGAVGRISESEHTRLVGNEVRKLIKERGHNAINCTVDYANTTGEGLALIVQQANREDLDWFIAIHFNAGRGRGVEVYTYQGRKYDDAVAVCKAIADLGFTNRGVKEGTGLYVISKTKAKSMLIEVCFVDSNDVDTYLRVGYKSIAKAIVDALCGYVESVPEIEQPTTEGVAYCTVPVLNVRDGAGINFSIQGELNLSEKVTVIEKSDDWRKVRYYNASKETTTTGWVNANYLKIDKDVQTIVIKEKPKKYWVVTDYIPQGKYGIEVKEVISKYFYDVPGGIYVRTNATQGLWIETCYLPLAKCEELKARLGNLFWEIKED